MKKIFIILTLLFATTLISCSNNTNNTNSTDINNSSAFKLNSKSTYNDIYSFSKEINIFSDNLTSSHIIANNTDYLLSNKLFNNKIYKIPKDKFKSNYDFKDMNASSLIANSIASLGDTILFSNGSDNGSIYSFKLSEFTNYNVNIKKLNNSNSTDFISTTKGVYYINQSDQNKLYRINEEGNENIAIIQDSCSQYSPHESWIVYENASDNFKLYAINLDDNSKVKLTDFSVESFAITNNIAYVTNSTDNNHIYRINLKSAEVKKLLDVSANNLIAIKNNLLFKNTDNYNELFKVDLSTEKLNISNLSLGAPNEYFLADEKMFFIYPNRPQTYVIKEIDNIIK